MLKSILCIVFILCTTCLQAQTEGIVVERTDIPIQPDEPLYSVFTNGKVVVMNQKGQKVYALGKDVNMRVSVGLLNFNKFGYLPVYKYREKPVYIDGQILYDTDFIINRQGEVVYALPAEVYDWRYDYFICRKDIRYASKYALWSADLKPLTYFDYGWIDKFSEGLARVSKEASYLESDGTYGYIDLQGKLVIPMQYRKYYKDEKAYLYELDFSEGKVPFIDDKTKKIGYLNTKGKVVLPPKYESAGKFEKGKALVFESCNYWYINEKGEVLGEGKDPNIYDKTKPETGIVLDSITKLYGYKNSQKEWVIKPTYSSIDKRKAYLWCSPLNSNRSFYTNKMVLADTLGKVLWQGNAYIISVDDYGYFWIQKNILHHYMFYNPQGTLLWQSDCKDYDHYSVETLLTCSPTEVKSIELSSAVDYDLTFEKLNQIFKRKFNPQKLGLVVDSLSQIPKTVYEMTNLENLYIRNTRISALSGKLTNLKKLQKLNISNNKFTTLPKVLYKMPQLQELEIMGNSIPFGEIIKLQKMFPKLKIIFKR